MAEKKSMTFEQKLKRIEEIGRELLGIADDETID